jgi:hypothetical protein
MTRPDLNPGGDAFDERNHTTYICFFSIGGFSFYRAKIDFFTTIKKNTGIKDSGRRRPSNPP